MNPLFKEISGLPTEQRNPATAEIDLASTTGILEMINAEDAGVAGAVRAELEHIARAVDIVVAAFRAGGRLFYVGAGTSGRLGIVDASECPPTFGTAPEMVQGIIAGGPQAVFQSQEGAEDSTEDGRYAIRERDIRSRDVVCGIAASGRTPFVLGALQEAAERGAKTILLTTATRAGVAERAAMADVLICPAVGPEVIAGSTRMKSGTAQKMVLNMLTTAAMIRIGKTCGNVMVDLQMTNAKLKERSRRIVMELTGLDYSKAAEALQDAGGHVKTALVMVLAGVDAETARARLEQHAGFVRKAVGL